MLGYVLKKLTDGFEKNGGALNDTFRIRQAISEMAGITCRLALAVENLVAISDCRTG